MEAGIVIHDLTHGSSTRLTDGLLNSGSSDGTVRSSALLSQYPDDTYVSDFIATCVYESTDCPMGAWSSNRAKGIHNFLTKEINLSTSLDAWVSMRSVKFGRRCFGSYSSASSISTVSPTPSSLLSPMLGDVYPRTTTFTARKRTILTAPRCHRCPSMVMRCFCSWLSGA